MKEEAQAKEYRWPEEMGKDKETVSPLEHPESYTGMSTPCF